MKRHINILILLFCAMAFQAHNTTNDEKKTVLQYFSMTNDFAEINMEIYDNGKFKVNINPEDDRRIKMKGHWENIDGYYILTFKKVKVNIKELFNMNDPNRFKVIDENTVKFSGQSSSLWIWGIRCERSNSMHNDKV